MPTHLQMAPWTLGSSLEVYSARRASKSNILCFGLKKKSNRRQFNVVVVGVDIYIAYEGSWRGPKME